VRFGAPDDYERHAPNKILDLSLVMKSNFIKRHGREQLLPSCIKGRARIGPASTNQTSRRLNMIRKTRSGQVYSNRRKNDKSSCTCHRNPTAYSPCVPSTQHQCQPTPRLAHPATPHFPSNSTPPHTRSNQHSTRNPLRTRNNSTVSPD